MAEFGENLKKAREHKGITQQTLASKLYVTRQAVSQWENGSRFPDLMMTKRIATALDISVNDLISEDRAGFQAENTPLIKNPFLRYTIILLYSFVAISSLLIFVDIVMRLKYVHTLPDTTWPYLLVIEMLAMILKTGIFSIGTLWTIKGKLTADKAGTIIVLFFALSAILDLHRNGMITAAHSARISAIVFSILLSAAAPVVGAAASFIFFKTRTIHPGYVVCIVCAAIHMTFTMLLNQTSAALVTTISNFLQICALISVITLTLLLLKNRRSQPPHSSTTGVQML